MIRNKEKLIIARTEISTEILKSKNINTFYLWEGTLVFSVLQIMIKISQDSDLQLKEKIKLFKSYINIYKVKQALKNFSPKFGKKAIPFLLIKINGPMFWFFICLAIPSKILDKFVPKNK